MANHLLDLIFKPVTSHHRGACGYWAEFQDFLRVIFSLGSGTGYPKDVGLPLSEVVVATVHLSGCGATRSGGESVLFWKYVLRSFDDNGDFFPFQGQAVLNQSRDRELGRGG